MNCNKEEGIELIGLSLTDFMLYGFNNKTNSHL